MTEGGVECKKKGFTITPSLKLRLAYDKHFKTISQFARVFIALAAILTELWTFFGRRP